MGRYLDRHAVPESIFYVGAPELDVERIRREGELRDAVEDFLDGFEAWRPPAAGPDPGEVRKAVLAFVRDRPELSWALADPGPGPRPFPWYGWVALVLGGLLLAPLLAAWLVLVRLSEPGEGRPDRAGTEAPTGGPAPGAAEAHVQELREHENRIVQNELSHVVEVRPGWVPRTTLRLLFPLLDWAGRRIYNQGQLLGVRTLHFVRWVTIDQGRRVLFLTNYDGGMVGYVADFVERSWQIPSVLTAIWSNTTGFPRTRWLFLEGARDVVRFTAFLRDHQVPTQVWYSGYKTLTTGNIVNNAAVHRGLSGEMADQEAAGWLRRL